jgi:hypothetical protein
MISRLTFDENELKVGMRRNTQVISIEDAIKGWMEEKSTTFTIKELTEWALDEKYLVTKSENPVSIVRYYMKDLKIAGLTRINAGTEMEAAQELADSLGTDFVESTDEIMENEERLAEEAMEAEDAAE